MPTEHPQLLVPGRPVPARRRRRWVGRSLLASLLVVLGVAAYHAIHGVVTNFGSPSCRAVALGRAVTFTPEQMGNAATITAVAVRRGLPARAATIALATALQESKLRNLTYGDQDSLGLFQQRTSQGWGTRAQILDPVHASNAFYDALIKISGYRTMSITAVAQKVQRSAFPAAYAQHEQEGRTLASVLSGLSPGGLGCRLDAPTASGDPAKVAAALARQLGARATVSGRVLTVRAADAQHAWATGAWAVALADADRVATVTVGDRGWTRSRDASSLTWTPARTPAGASNAVTITLR